MIDGTTPTHTAFAMKREGRRNNGRLIEVGTARQEESGVIHLFMDRLPIGGFNGYVHLAPIGVQPTAPEPGQPGQNSEDEGE